LGNDQKLPYFEGKDHNSPYLYTELVKVARTKEDSKKLYFHVWPLAKFGSSLFWMITIYLLEKKTDIYNYPVNAPHRIPSYVSRLVAVITSIIPEPTLF
jgi:hypothetical protein